MPRKWRARVMSERFGVDVSGGRVQRDRLGLVQPGLEP